MNLCWVTLLMKHVVIFPLSTLTSKIIYTSWDLAYEVGEEESINRELNNNGPQVDVSLPMEDTEGDFSNFYREIIRTESATNQANKEVIKCYYKFREALSERLIHYERSYRPRAAAQILVNRETRKQLPNVTEAKIHKLFSIGEELISLVSFTASDPNWRI
ncbi:4327_t:CDS:2 [Funneliformis mosseae]|uniref:4327_t:CDS:1 n=1 Tax=Funneliformis mosseae TaxID=27381 RepID=A0A9N9H4M6_FUNMO|nr:4327_t:CDS:2 [Funneliformis mosseae]